MAFGDVQCSASPSTTSRPGFSATRVASAPGTPPASILNRGSAWSRRLVGQQPTRGFCTPNGRLPYRLVSTMRGIETGYGRSPARDPVGSQERGKLPLRPQRTPYRGIPRLAEAGALRRLGADDYCLERFARAGPTGAKEAAGERRSRGGVCPLEWSNSILRLRCIRLTG